MVVRERLWHGVVVFAALVALVIGSIGIVSQSAQSFPAMAQAAVAEVEDFSSGGEQDSQVASGDMAYSYIDLRYENCFFMSDDYGNSSAICVPKPWVYG